MLVSNIIGVVVGIGMLLAFQSIVYRLEDPKPTGYFFDIFTAGLYILPMAITMLVVIYPIGVLISKNRNKTIHLRGSNIGAIGFLRPSTAADAIQIPSTHRCLHRDGDVDRCQSKPAGVECKATGDGTSDSHEHSVPKCGK